MTASVLTTPSAHAGGTGLLRLADPKVTLASAASLALGTAAAAGRGPLAWGWLVLTVLGIFLLEAAKNASGEVVDFDSGADQAVAPEDRSPLSGGKRVILDGLLSRRATMVAAAAFYASSAAVGLAIATRREARVLGLGLAGFALAYFYHAAPLRLAYRGFGELAVAAAYGPLVAGGAYLVQRGAFPDAPVVLLSCGLGLQVAAFLVANEFPDRRADASVGKRTLVVRLGCARAARLFGAASAAAFSCVPASLLAGAPGRVLFSFAGAPFAFAAWRRLTNEGPHTARVVMAQRWALAAFVLMAAGAAAGLSFP